MLQQSKRIQANVFIGQKKPAKPDKPLSFVKIFVFYIHILNIDPKKTFQNLLFLPE